MARYGVIADIHGNLEALQAALGFLDGETIDRIVCLGDVVGYNADGDACVDLLRARGIDAIAGNHDLIAAGRLGLQRCGRKAAHALRRARRRLDAESIRYLDALPSTRRYEGCVQLIHGGIDDPTRYLRTPAHVRKDALRLAAREPAIRFCLHGHTHDPALHRVVAGGCDAGRVERLPGFGEQDLAVGEGDVVFFINPGSVDAARKDGYGHAELAIFDTDRLAVRFVQIPYDAVRAERRARRAGYRMGPLDRLRFRAFQELARVRARLRRPRPARPD